MPPRSTQKRSGRTADPSTDKAHLSVNDSISPTDMWDGGQVEQGPWFHKRVQHALENFAYKLLCTAAVVSIPSKGQVAVHSVEHAKEHLENRCQGTILAPNMRTRENLPPSTTAPRTTAAPPTPAHGGYPGTPTPTTTAPATTYASTVSSSGRPLSLLEEALGQHARGYVISPLMIEELDEEFLVKNFLDYIENDRLKRTLRARAKGSGRLFMMQMREELLNGDMSMTGEDTIQSKLDIIVKPGLPSPRRQCTTSSRAWICTSVGPTHCHPQPQ